MCPPSAIFPHNHTSLFAEVESAANLRYIGAYGRYADFGYSYVIIYLLIVDFLDFSSLLRRVFIQIITKGPFTVQNVRTQPTYVHFVLFLPFTWNLAV